MTLRATLDQYLGNLVCCSVLYLVSYTLALKSSRYMGGEISSRGIPSGVEYCV